jgi:FkbM family methyltransferase
MGLFSLIPDSIKDRIRRRAGAVTIADRLSNLRAAGFAPKKIIDAGAYVGDWSKMAAGIFPEASLLLIEPQPQLAKPLAALCAGMGRARHRGALLGRQSGRADFVVQETISRIITDPENWPAGQVVSIPVVTLAEVAAEEGFTDCGFLKLDLQGHELEALAGAGALFGSAEAILLESSWLPIGECPLAAEVIATVSARGYQLYDVMGFNYRPLDRALWQTDFLFVRRDSPLLARRRDWE